MENVQEFKIFDFQAEKQKRMERKEFAKRYEHIKSKCQIGNAELLDSLIDEVVITEESTRSLMDFIKACQRREWDPTLLFEQALWLYEDAYHDETGVNWWIAIEDALTFYAMLKQQDPVTYELTINRTVSADY